MNLALRKAVGATTDLVVGAACGSARLTWHLAGAAWGALGRVAGAGRTSTRTAPPVASDGVFSGPISVAAPKPEMDDVTLSRKVETEIFRDTRGIKSAVSVNAVGGIVYLRGEVKRPDQIDELERRTLEIPEVLRVENLLHLPKTPAPTSAETPRRAQRTSPAPKAKSVRPVAESTGREPAERGEGRQPAPPGSAGQRTGGEPEPDAAPPASPREGADAPRTAESPVSSGEPGFTLRVQEEMRKESPGDAGRRGERS